MSAEPKSLPGNWSMYWQHQLLLYKKILISIGHLPKIQRNIWRENHQIFNNAKGHKILLTDICNIGTYQTFVFKCATIWSLASSNCSLSSLTLRRRARVAVKEPLTCNRCQLYIMFLPHHLYWWYILKFLYTSRYEIVTVSIECACFMVALMLTHLNSLAKNN